MGAGGEADYRVGLLQFAPRLGGREENLAVIAAGLAGSEAELFVMPELATCGYALPNREAALALAERPEGSPGLSALQALAERKGAALAVGLPLAEGERLYNAAALLRPGQAPHFYRKLHLFDRERELFDPGDRAPAVVDHRGLRIGLMICFDWVFPELARCLALAGADLLAHPANLVLPGLAQAAMVTRALENGVFAATANRVGEERRQGGTEALRFTGRSQLLDPGGRVLLAFGETESRCAVARIAPGAAREKRLTPRNHLLTDRRPECYAGLLEPHDGGA
jgi:predicted amidohydrolase